MSGIANWLEGLVSDVPSWAVYLIACAVVYVETATLVMGLIFPSTGVVLAAGVAAAARLPRKRTVIDLDGDGSGSDPLGRGPAADVLRTVLDMITFAMQRDPLLTEAMTRAFMFADASATAEVDNVAGTIDRLFARAIVGAEREPDEEDLAIARVIADVWMSNLVQWLTRRASATDVTNRMELTVRLLLKGRAA